MSGILKSETFHSILCDRCLGTRFRKGIVLRTIKKTGNREQNKNFNLSEIVYSTIHDFWLKFLFFVLCFLFLRNRIHWNTWFLIRWYRYSLFLIPYFFYCGCIIIFSIPCSFYYAEPLTVFTPINSCR